jgi:hypothetical protein
MFGPTLPRALRPCAARLYSDHGRIGVLAKVRSTQVGLKGVRVESDLQISRASSPAMSVGRTVVRLETVEVGTHRDGAGGVVR